MPSLITTLPKRTVYPVSIKTVLAGGKLVNGAVVGGKQGKELFVTVSTTKCDWGCEFCGLGSLDGKRPPLSFSEAREQMESFFSQLPESERLQIVKVSMISMSSSLLLQKTVEPSALIEMAKIIPKFLPNIVEASIESRSDVKDDAALGTAKNFFEELSRGLNLPSLVQEIVIGIESAKEEIRRAVGKWTTDEQIEELAVKLNKLGINLRGYFIYNLLERDDNVGALKRDIDFMAGLGKRTGVTPSILILRGYVPEGYEQRNPFAGFKDVSDRRALKELREAATYATGKVKFEIDPTNEDQAAADATAGSLSLAYRSAVEGYDLTFNPYKLHIPWYKSLYGFVQHNLERLF